MAAPLVCGAMLLMPPPAGLSPAGWAAAAVAVLMALWWVTEAVPLAIVALLPLILFPPLGIASLEATSTSYSNPLIFLFFGGFLLATAMQKWALHRRLALSVLAHSRGGPASLIGRLMAVTAFVSLWVSNTATAMVMLPIAQSIAVRVGEAGRSESHDRMEPTAFRAALMLGVAYAATIGGMGTLIGTPPNALLAGYMQESHGVTITFAQWMLIGIPLVLLLLPTAWLILTRIAFGRLSDDSLVLGDTMPEKLPPMTREERQVTVLLVATALAWLLRPLLVQLAPGLAISDAGIALAAAMLLFIIPVRSSVGGFLLSWRDVAALRWDVLILFGGGLALASGIERSGLAQWIGDSVAGMGALPLVLLTLLIITIVVFLGELASNTAIAAVFIPLSAATALGLGENALTLALPAALAASLGFMLPVATPPNAIVFGSGAVSTRQMLKAGLILNIAGIMITAAVALTLGRYAFGF